MQDGPADVGSGKGFKRSGCFGSIELSSPQQPKQTHLNQIIERFGAATAIVHRNRRHQSAVVVNPLVALEQGSAGDRAIGPGRVLEGLGHRDRTDGAGVGPPSFPTRPGN